MRKDGFPHKGAAGVPESPPWDGLEMDKSEEVRAGGEGRDRYDTAEWGQDITDLLVRGKGTKIMRRSSLVIHPDSPGSLQAP